MTTMHGRAKWRNIIVARTNTCGGNNKSGLPSLIGPISSRNVLSCNKSCSAVPKTCIIKKNVFMHYRHGTKYLG